VEQFVNHLKALPV